MTGALSPVTRPVVRWFGGKWKLAPWIISHFPPHRIYVEPFGGGASVLLRKPRYYSEVYNDLDGEIVNLFRVLRDRRQATRLIELLHLTPFARQEWRDAYEISDDPVEKARQLLVRSFMGFGANGHNVEASTGFFVPMPGATARRRRSIGANYPGQLAYAVERLQGHHDRESRRLGRHAGAALPDWRRVERAAFADGARPRTEVLWLNPACVEGLNAARRQGDLLGDIGARPAHSGAKAVG